MDEYDYEKEEFKRDELEWELRDEDPDSRYHGWTPAWEDEEDEDED